MKFVMEFEAVVPPVGEHNSLAEHEEEDGGAARLVTIVAEDSPLFVTLQSYDENWGDYGAHGHPEIDSLVGKRIKVTVEVEE